jgi:hypothetical protein
LNRWLAVVGCCVVCLTAPLDLDTVVQVLTRTLPPSQPQRAISELDNNDDEDALLRPGVGSESQENVRKLLRLAGHSQPPRCCDSQCGLHFHPAERLAIRPGGEHALRNGCGAPLLC